MKPNLSVIIPVYNEEKTIFQVLCKVNQQKEVKEIIIVNDGSYDNTENEVNKFILSHKDIKKSVFVSHGNNQGKGAAIITGLEKVQGEFSIIQDADLEYDPNDYQLLLKCTRKNIFVFGKRWHNKRGYLLAQLGNWYMTKITNLLFRSSFEDPYTCYKLGPTKIWKNMQLKSTGFEVEAEITAKLALKNYSVIEVPVKYQPRSFSEGKKINWKDIIKGSFKLFKLRFGLDL